MCACVALSGYLRRSVVEAAFILAILLGIAKSTDYAREAEHLESLQLGRIRRIVPLTRKFWTLVRRDVHGDPPSEKGAVLSTPHCFPPRILE